MNNIVAPPHHVDTAPKPAKPAANPSMPTVRTTRIPQRRMTGPAEATESTYAIACKANMDPASTSRILNASTSTGSRVPGTVRQPPTAANVADARMTPAVADSSRSRCMAPTYTRTAGKSLAPRRGSTEISCLQLSSPSTGSCRRQIAGAGRKLLRMKVRALVRSVSGIGVRVAVEDCGVLAVWGLESHRGAGGFQGWDSKPWKA
jgi:hypothetical protein